VVVSIALNDDVHEARVVPHVVVVPIMCACCPLYTPGGRMSVFYRPPRDSPRDGEFVGRVLPRSETRRCKET
jgi:hypothetical protein